MPQVDEVDLGGLIDWVHERGVQTVTKWVPPKSIRGHQKVDREKVRHIPACALSKSVLISKDHVVIDGNHRWMAHVHRDHQTMMVTEIELPFDEAIQLVRDFPKSYAYGDGDYHPETF